MKIKKFTEFEQKKIVTYGTAKLAIPTRSLPAASGPPESP